MKLKILPIMREIAVFTYVLVLNIVHYVQANTPLVLWHGMGDSCCNPHTTGLVIRIVEKYIPDIYVHSIQIGENPIDDTVNSFVMNTNEKIQIACDKIKGDAKLKDGYNALGISQGSQFLRAVAQRCPDPPMLNLVSLGGQHQGVYGLPNCFEGFVCRSLAKAVSLGVYFGLIQNNLVQASYWHDPLDEHTYRKYNRFIADINQERVFNSEYRENLIKLKNLVLVKFEFDQMIQPRESQWFGFYKENDLSRVYTMEESPLFFNDTLGLRTLNETGRLHKLSLPGRHIQITQTWLANHIILQFLKDKD